MPKRKREYIKENIDNNKLSKLVNISSRSLPPKLERLNNIFQKLSPFCAFCEARLTNVMTFEKMKNAVPELTIEDLAAIKLIAPHFIHYEYMSASDSSSNSANESVIQVQFGKQLSIKANEAKHSRAMKNKGDQIDIQRHLLSSDKILKTVKKDNDMFLKALNKFIQQNSNDSNDQIERRMETQLKKYLLDRPHPSIILSDNGDNDDNQSSLENILSKIKHQPFYQQQLGDNNLIEIPEKSSKFGKHFLLLLTSYKVCP